MLQIFLVVKWSQPLFKDFERFTHSRCERERFGTSAEAKVNQVHAALAKLRLEQRDLLRFAADLNRKWRN